jgi:hypothetical protein
MNHRNLIFACVGGAFVVLLLLWYVVVCIWLAWYFSFSLEPLGILYPLKRLVSFIQLRFAQFWRGLRVSLQGRNKFVYEPLDSEKSQIRLLKLLPGSNRQRVECVSFTISLDDEELNYEELHILGAVLLRLIPFPQS